MLENYLWNALDHGSLWQ